MYKYKCIDYNKHPLMDTLGSAAINVSPKHNYYSFLIEVRRSRTLHIIIIRFST